MNPTKIERTDYSWSPITGCTPIREGCKNCYARRLAETRLRGRHGYPKDEPFRVTFHPDRLDEPLKMKRPRRIFVCSMGDLFHEDVPLFFIDKIFQTIYIAQSYQHIFIILTKRPERMLEYAEYRRLAKRQWPDNILAGVSISNQQDADDFIPILLQIPGKHFVSIEPMLGPIDLTNPTGDFDDFPNENKRISRRFIDDLDWVVIGGETGPGARPMHPDWVRDIKSQCQKAGVPFFFKQWGEWWTGNYIDCPIVPSGRVEKIYPWPNGREAFKIGRKYAGRILDGRTWDEVP